MMNAAQYRTVKKEVAMYINQGKPLAAAHVHEQWACLFTLRQYYELADVIYAALKATDEKEGRK